MGGRGAGQSKILGFRFESQLGDAFGIFRMRMKDGMVCCVFPSMFDSIPEMNRASISAAVPWEMEDDAWPFSSKNQGMSAEFVAAECEIFRCLEKGELVHPYT